MERLHKVMARRGVASLRKCEEMIAAGRVKVNGKLVAQPGFAVDEQKDLIEVDGRELESEPEKVYLLLNKPRGYVTTVKDPQRRKTVMDLLPARSGRIYPVGRLDRDTEGLLLLTNDGDLSFALTHPSHLVEKVYIAEVESVPPADKLQQLERGIRLEDGITAPANVKVINRGAKPQIRISIHEGRKRQVRRMFEAIGHPVVGLRRIQFGPLREAGLRPGQFRFLNPTEIARLKKLEKRISDAARKRETDGVNRH